MNRNALWKWLILVVLLAGSMWVVYPPKDKIRLGLDLKGGTSFVVKIDRELVEQEIRARAPNLPDEQVKAEVDEVLNGAQARALEVMRNRVDNLGIDEPVIYPGKDNRIVIQLPGIDEQKREEAERSIKSLAFLQFRMVHEDNGRLVGELFEQGLAPEGYRIVRLSTGTFYKEDPAYTGARDTVYRARVGRFHIPDPAYELLMEKAEADNQTVYRPYFVKRRHELSGEYLKSAGVDYETLGQPVVTLRFDGKGAKLFANVTSDYAPGGPRNPDPQSFRQLAIVLDGTLYSAPTIREGIYGGRAQISGSFSQREAILLANILNAGSLPAPVRIVEKRFVAPSLGSDSIHSGIRAITIGAVVVVVFMAGYYLLCGVVADIALVLNMLLLPLGMIAAAGFLGIFASEGGGGGPIKLPVLTLPGIAGILLTIGMAVDANVLIYERIREEKESGKRVWTAILAGYDRAFLTILDANLTTLLAGVILFVFGSGPIRGFSVTLCAGILVSMFTALVVTKLIFGLFAERLGMGALRMLSVLGHTAIDFVGKRRLAIGGSILVILVTWGLLVYNGVQDPTRVLGVDFTGGVSVTLKVNERVPMAEVRGALAGAGLTEAHLQYQDEMEQGGDIFLQVKAAAAAEGQPRVADVVARTLAETFPDKGFVVWQDDEVGPQIGAELTRRAVWSIVFSLVGMIIYISWRFELGFAMGAIVALAHDVLITTGLYTLFGRQISLTIVAALLTIVGYSVNDTIVIFDRIREDLKLEKNRSFVDLCNLSINQTLSRTILTSLTTLLTALALLIGIVAGTYSTIFIATPVVLWWHHWRKPEFEKKAA